jgi:hypothetical protein
VDKDEDDSKGLRGHLACVYGELENDAAVGAVDKNKNTTLQLQYAAGYDRMDCIVALVL